MQHWTLSNKGRHYLYFECLEFQHPIKHTTTGCAKHLKLFFAEGAHKIIFDPSPLMCQDKTNTDDRMYIHWKWKRRCMFQFVSGLFLIKQVSCMTSSNKTTFISAMYIFVDPSKEQFASKQSWYQLGSAPSAHSRARHGEFLVLLVVIKLIQ